MTSIQQTIDRPPPPPPPPRDADAPVPAPAAASPPRGCRDFPWHGFSARVFPQPPVMTSGQQTIDPPPQRDAGAPAADASSAAAAPNGKALAPVDVLILTKDEEVNLPHALRSVVG